MNQELVMHFKLEDPPQIPFVYKSLSNDIFLTIDCVRVCGNITLAIFSETNKKHEKPFQMELG